VTECSGLEERRNLQRKMIGREEAKSLKNVKLKTERRLVNVKQFFGFHVIGCSRILMCVYNLVGIPSGAGRSWDWGRRSGRVL